MAPKPYEFIGFRQPLLAQRLKPPKHRGSAAPKVGPGGPRGLPCEAGALRAYLRPAGQISSTPGPPPAKTGPKPAKNQPKTVQNQPQTNQNRSKTGQKTKSSTPAGYIRYWGGYMRALAGDSREPIGKHPGTNREPARFPGWFPFGSRVAPGCVRQGPGGPQLFSVGP
jgi:hypothetical protein